MQKSPPRLCQLIFGSVLLFLWLASSEIQALPYELAGRYANRLSQSDLEQIKSVVSKERAVSHTLKKIEAIAADKVHVQSGGRIAVDQDKYYEFDVYKRGGGWAIDLNSIQISIEQRDRRTGPTLIR